MIDYLTAYNGAWYEYMLTEEWTDEPIWYEPPSIFGVGTY